MRKFLVPGVFFLMAIFLPAAAGESGRPPFYPDDPYFFYDPLQPLHPGQWNLLNQAPALIHYPAAVAPNGHQTASVDIGNVGLDANILGAWQHGYTGRGVVIGILDDGVRHDHPDLDLVREWCVDLDKDGIVAGRDGSPHDSGDMHGTCVAGVAAAVGGNGLGVCGYAPHARLVSIRNKTYSIIEDYYIHADGYYYLAGLGWQSGMAPAEMAGLTALLEPPDVQVKNSSTKTCIFDYPDGYSDVYSAVARMAANGVIFTQAAGNCRETRQQDANVPVEGAHPYIINVLAMGSAGTYSLYSNFGAPAFVTMLSESAYWNPLGTAGKSAYANGLGVSTTDLAGTAGCNYECNTSSVFLPDLPDLDYTNQFDGTSAAAPSAAGLLAVAKQANPNLDGRMARHLLARTSRVVDPEDRSESSTWSAGGMSASGWSHWGGVFHFNPDYGFGLPDAAALAEAARGTLGVTAETIFATGLREVAPAARAIPAGDPAGQAETVSVSVPPAMAQALESVEAYVQIQGEDRGEWQVVLGKDNGQRSSRLWTPAMFENPRQHPMFGDPHPENGLDRFLCSNAFWGADPNGDWTMHVSNPAGTHPAQWLKWGLVLHMGEIVFTAPVLVFQDLETRGLSLVGPDAAVRLDGLVKCTGDVLVHNGILNVGGVLRNGDSVLVSRLDRSLVNATESLDYRRGLRVEIGGGCLTGGGQVIAPTGSDGRGGVFNVAGLVRCGGAESAGSGLTIGGPGPEETAYVQEAGGSLELVSDGTGWLYVHGSASLSGSLRVVAGGPAGRARPGDLLEGVITAGSWQGDFDDMDLLFPSGQGHLFWKPELSANRLDLAATPYDALPMGVPLPGALDAAHGENWYVFRAEAGQSYRLQLQAPAGWTAELHAGIASAGSADDETRLDFTAARDMFYYIRVLPATPGAEGTFRIRVDRLVGGVLYHPAVEDGRYAQTIAAMVPYVAEQMGQNNVAGLAVALVDGEDVVWSAGFGYADVEGGIPYLATTLSQIGSVSKTLTAVAVLQLAETGLIGLDEPLDRILPEFSIHPTYAGQPAITPRAMLFHHSGIPNTPDDGPGSVTLDDQATAFLSRILAGLPDEYTCFPPGEIYQYSNTAFSLLGLAVARASGQDFNGYTRDNIFARLGMSDSAFLFDSAHLQMRGLAREYQNGALVAERWRLNVQGAGSVYTTAADMAKYISALLGGGQGAGGRILTPESVQEMFSVQNTDSPLDFSSRMGLGWTLDGEPGLAYAGRLVEKDGASPVAFCSDLKLMPDRALGVVFIFNTAGSPVHELTTKTLQAAVEEKYGLEPPDSPAIADSPVVWNTPPAELDALNGVYITTNGFDRVSTYLGASGGNGLAWTKGANAEDTAGTMVLFPRENGWYAPGGDDYAKYQYRFPTVAGRRVMVGRQEVAGPGGAAITQQKLRGERLEAAGSLPGAWAGRTGSYKISDERPDEYLNSFCSFDLRLADGLLRMELPDGSTYVLDTSAGGDTLAFIAGLGRNQSEAVRILNPGGAEQIHCLGRTFNRLGDLNLDGWVDNQDLGVLLAYLAGMLVTLPGGGTSGDLNLDGQTDILDLTTMLSLLSP